MGQQGVAGNAGWTPIASTPLLPTGDIASLTPQDRPHAEALRIVTYLMLVRTALATVLMLSVVIVAWTVGSPETLASPFGRFVFALLATTYLASLAYAVSLRRIQNPIRFADIQIGVDLVLVTLLVHATGGAQSGYTFLYLVDVVAVTLLPRGFGAASVSTASALLYLCISLLGYLKVLPAITGQTVFPWDLTVEDLVFRLVVFLAGLVSVGSLGVGLARQRRKVGERLVKHQQLVGDLASLHQNTIRCLSSGLVTTTLDGTITTMNDAACEILGFSGLPAIGHKLASHIPALDALLDSAGALGRVQRDEVDAVRSDGHRRRLGLSATPLSDHAGEVIGRVIHFQDLTELRHMEQMVARAEHLAGIGRLAANIAHEIRNPLASISGAVEMLKRLPETDAETSNLVAIAVREVDRVNALISNLLDYARPRTDERQRLDLGEMAQEIGTIFEQERRMTEIALQSRTPSGIFVESAPGQMQQVLWNLLRNAADAMPRGGTIQLSVSRQQGDAALAMLSVRDTGVGIAKEDMDHIFEPFFSRKPGGTGLGLATTARIVEAHRGTIDVASEPGAGSTFTVRIPCIA
ncbi:MAG: PAS domain-containing protein [Deltaproteobacteria bacterium]|nr:PAS domain-containing protein [Deltaproteobacteria bacterium]